MERTLAGKTALVTGAARGIGRQIAIHLAESGAFVYVTDIDMEGARRSAEELGGSASAMQLDVRDRPQVRAAVAQIGREKGVIDILVNNAGLMTQGPFARISGEEWDDMVAVNLGGVFNCVQTAAPLMMASGKGSIINIASVSAMKGGGAIGNVWYGSTKAAVVAMTKGLARELGPNGIRVNAIAPGVVETDMVKKALTPEVRERILNRFPLGRLATGQDVANMAVFLASDLSSFVTGQAIAVDGGFLNT
jgi:3-oxoacyl-[acyl-carrier protein] reductase